MSGETLSRNKAALVRSLQSRKGREEHGLFTVEGEKSVNELLRSGLQVEFLAGTGRGDQYRGIPFFLADAREMKKISSLATPPGILAVARIPEEKSLSELSGPFLLLDRVSDPGNLGTILRTADWFGFGGLICSPGTVDPYNQKAIQASMGSFARVPVLNLDLVTAVNMLREKGYAVYSAMLGGKTVYSETFTAKSAVVMGSESHGVDKALASLCTPVSIPGTGRAESLNVAVATAIIAAEIYRQTS